MASEPLFEMCSFDSENPYCMVLRAMAQDPGISPKAKGVFLYLISMPPNWKIYHSQLRKALDIGEDYLNSAMEELVNQGYAYRTRERVNGSFRPYTYKLSQLKKFSPKLETGTGDELKKCSPNGVSRPGFPGPGNPVIDSKREENIQEKQQQYIEEPSLLEKPVESNDVSPSAVVFSQQEKQSTERPKKASLSSKAKIAKPKPSAPEPFYAKPKKEPEPIPEQFELFVPPPEASVKPNSIPKFFADFEIDPDPAIDLTEKRQILARYSHETIEKAVLFVIANLSKIKTTKIAYLKMACEKGLSVQESKPKLSTLEELKIYFEPYGVYHGATCYINDLGIVFERGMKFGEVKIDKYFSWERVEIMCKSFGIEFTRDLKPKIRDPQ